MNQSIGLDLSAILLFDYENSNNNHNINTNINININTNTNHNTNTNINTNIKKILDVGKKRKLPIFNINSIYQNEDNQSFDDLTHLTNYKTTNITKNYFSVFQKTNIHNKLSKLNIKKLIMCGYNFNTSIKSSINMALSLKSEINSTINTYDIIIISDAIDTNFEINTNFEIDSYLQNQNLQIIDSTDEFVKMLLCVGSGDSYLITNTIESEINNTNQFNDFKNSINWKTMLHNGNDVPRLITQECIYEENGFVPIYRHPVDKQLSFEPFSEFTKQLAKQIETKLTLPYKLNHVLIQQYRSGSDFIGEHSDKTLDIEPNTSVINYSMGATRYLTLKNKLDKSQTQNIALSHNSIFILGSETNKNFYHMIKRDKRPDIEKTFDELDFDGIRISYTFRSIKTFYNLKTNEIKGQGAPTTNGKKKINGLLNDYKEMIDAFGYENHDVNFDTNKHYKNGFYAIDMNTVATNATNATNVNNNV
jgi:alkylated DNA repair dioxygenase AlkB